MKKENAAIFYRNSGFKNNRRVCSVPTQESKFPSAFPWAVELHSSYSNWILLSKESFFFICRYDIFQNVQVPVNKSCFSFFCLLHISNSNILRTMPNVECHFNIKPPQSQIKLFSFSTSKLSSLIKKKNSCFKLWIWKLICLQIHWRHPFSIDWESPPPSIYSFSLSISLT